LGSIKNIHLESYVWNDLNKNGIQDADEPGIANVEVELLDNNNNSLAKTKDSGGNINLKLGYGDYQVQNFTNFPGRNYG